MYTSLKEALLSRVKNATDINNIQTIKDELGIKKEQFVRY